MNAFSLILLSLGLSADAFAVSVTCGLLARAPYAKRRLFVAACFGFFQAVMPALGHWAGRSIAAFVAYFAHWAAFALLSILGCKTIAMAVLQRHRPQSPRTLTVAGVFVQAVATSIDALSAGIGFAIIGESIFPEALCIGLVTFVCCYAGFSLGRRFGAKLADGAMLCGGILLIAIGIHLIISHYWPLV